MSDSSLAMRLAGRAGIDGQLRDVEEELCDDIGCFGCLRGVRERAVMLELRQRSGNILAISYAFVERIEFDPSVGIVLHAAGQRIVIEGRNLNGPAKSRARLFEALVWHRVPWLTETPRDERLMGPDDACRIERITW